MKDLSEIDGWKRGEPKADHELTEEGEIWRSMDDSTEELVINRSNLEEPRKWTVILLDGRQRFSNKREMVAAIAGLYMQTGSV